MAPIGDIDHYPYKHLDSIFCVIHDDSKQEAIESLKWQWQALTRHSAKNIGLKGVPFGDTKNIGLKGVPFGDSVKYTKFYDKYKSSWRNFNLRKLLELFREYDNKYS